MKILLDENLPRKLKNFITGHEVFTVSEMKWSGKKYGELLALLRPHGFDVLVTADKNLRFQHPIEKYKVAVILLRADDNRLSTLRQLVPEISSALEIVRPGQISEVTSKNRHL